MFSPETNSVLRSCPGTRPYEFNWICEQTSVLSTKHLPGWWYKPIVNFLGKRELPKQWLKWLNGEEGEFHVSRWIGDPPLRLTTICCGTEWHPSARTKDDSATANEKAIFRRSDPLAPVRDSTNTLWITIRLLIGIHDVHSFSVIYQHWHSYDMPTTLLHLI